MCDYVITPISDDITLRTVEFYQERRPGINGFPKDPLSGSAHPTGRANDLD